MSEATGVLVIAGSPGREAEQRFEWNGNPEDRAVARAAFDRMLAEGGIFASVVDSPGRSTQVRSFDEVEAIERERGTVTAKVSRQVVGG